MKLNNSFLLRDLDKTLAIAGVIGSLILIVYLGTQIGRSIYLLTGVLALISCLLWLALRSSNPLKFHIPTSPTLTHAWAFGFFCLYILSVISIYLRSDLYQRPLIYFILTAFMAGIIACEILTSGRQHAGLILIQIVLLGMSIAWSQLLIFPSLLGVDPWYHSALTNGIVDNGYIPDGYVYSNLPLFHLQIAVISLIADLPYKIAAMVSVSLVQIVCNAVFVFLIGYSLFKILRIGLLAALLVIIANYHIFMSYWSIPNAYAAIFIPVVLYLAFFKFKGKSCYSSIILFTTVFAAIILTHTITAVCMGILLVIMWVAPIFYRTYHSGVENYVVLLLPIGFIAAMLGWWAYASGTLQSLGNFIDSGYSIELDIQISDVFRSYAVAVPLQEQLISYFGMFLFFAVSFIGVFYMISRKGSGSTFTMAWVGIAPLAIGFFSLISGRTVIEERWWYFAQILLSIPLAVAIYSIGTWKIKNLNVLYCFVFGFIVALSFLMLISPVANVDNHMLSPITGSTNAYTESEMVASEFFAVESVGKISSDSNYCTNPSSSIFTNVYKISQGRLSGLEYSLVTGEFSQDGSIKIMRTKWLHEPLTTGGLSIWIRPDTNEILSGLGFNKIYENPSMTGYID